MNDCNPPPVAIVTGAARGIGLATAKHLLDRGYAVALLDIDDGAGHAAGQSLADHGEAAYIPCDVGDEDDVHNAAKQTVDRFGRIDALVNNAGIGCGKPLAELPLDDWNRVLAVNLTGAFLMTKACAPRLTEQRGAVVNIASTRALQSEPDTEAYSATKGGLVALTHAMAVSLGPAVRVNCISPGWINTSSNAYDAHHHDQHPVGRIGTAEDVARLAGFLLSDQAGFITGSNHVIDGGMTRKMIYED